jgi:carbonic anhydrase
MEYACGIANSKIIIVLGHTKCGAITSACNDFEMGYITGLLEKIKPAIVNEKTIKIDRNGSNTAFVNEVSTVNIHLTINNIRQKSSIIRKLEEDNKILIIGALYDIETGIVTFYDEHLTNEILKQELNSDSEQ